MTASRAQFLSWPTLLMGLVGVATAGWMATGEARTMSLAWNSLWLTAGACCIGLPLGTLLALLLSRTDLPLRRACAMALGIMLLIPLYLQAAAWDAGFGQLGWYSSAGGDVASPWLQGWRAAVWIHGLAAAPWAALVVGAGLRYVSPELEEQALLDGSSWQVLVHVTLRTVAPSLVIATIWLAAAISGEMTVTDLYRVRTLAEELYTGFAQSSDVTASSSDADLPRAQQVPIDAELVSADVESANIHSGSINRSNSMLVKAKPMDENNTDEITLRDVWKNRTVRIIVVSVLVIAFCLVVGLSVGLSIHEAREQHASHDDP